MAKLVEAKQVEQVIRRYLEGKGYTLSHPKMRGETGVDITAIRGDSTWLVEVIGFQSHPPTRSREFYEAFFRIISRDRGDPDDVLAIGLPTRFKDGMKQRKKQYEVAWSKLGKAFPNLQLWYVDIENSKVDAYSWSNPF